MIEYSKNWNSLTYWESNRETTINFEYSHMALNKSNTYSKQKKINGIVKCQALLLNLCSNITNTSNT